MNTNTEMMKEELIAKYEPLVKATAKRYAGRGAEYEDLVQEGYLALLILNEKCTDKNWLTAFIASRLPGLRQSSRRETQGAEKKDQFRRFRYRSRSSYRSFRSREKAAY